jgi:hypothetical protein
LTAESLVRFHSFRADRRSRSYWDVSTEAAIVCWDGKLRGSNGLGVFALVPLKAIGTQWAVWVRLPGATVDGGAG